MKYVLIAGKARSGKDFITQCLLKHFENSRRRALADELKEYLCVLFNISLEELNELKNTEEEFTKSGTTMRQLLQRLGTDIFFTYVDKDYWIKALVKHVNANFKDCDYVFIPDFRYPHEYTDLKKYIDPDDEVLTVCIKGNSETIKASEHISENAMEGYVYDYVFDNTDYTKLESELEKLIDFLQH